MVHEIVFVYNKSNPYGISEDVKVLEQVLKKKGYGKIRHSDPLEPPVLCDMAIYFEIPVYSYYPWARLNVMLVNPEWWEEGWNSYLAKTDVLLFKCDEDSKRFLETRKQYLQGSCEVYTLPWATRVKSKDYEKYPQSKEAKDGFLWLVGGSRHKRAAAEKVIPLWKESWPPLHVYSREELQVNTTQSNITFHVEDVEESKRRQLQAYYPGHIIISESESLGMVGLEGEAAGAFLLGNRLPTYTELYGDKDGSVYLLDTELETLKAGVRDTFTKLTDDALEKAIEVFKNLDLEQLRKKQKDTSLLRIGSMEEKAKEIFETIFRSEYFTEKKANLKTLPPIVSTADLPNISVITLLHNRRSFIDLAFHNLLSTDYPLEKIEWVVVEDSDDVKEQGSDKIMKFAREAMEAKKCSVSYIPLQKPVSIGEKRNIGVKRSQHDIILFMDDDDHYPVTSFRRRVSWLLRHPWGVDAAACTSIACYDLLKGTSAVNTPPFSLGLKERVSEATLIFRKKFWEEKPFPTVNMAEGEGFLEGREGRVLELQPQQMIVAMSHGGNTSSRRIPPGPSGKPSCFWGFPKEFLIFLHKLAGVQIEEDKSIPSSTKSTKGK